jgi:pimeloyl-ACP methyl ester carboxylesterase
MKTLKSISLIILVLIVITSVKAQTSATEKPTIVFVHGIWADGSSFNEQTAALQAKGYHVVAIQNPITSLAEDVATTQRALNLIKGKVILVGHSWGGFVISQVGNDPKVVGMVYLAAYAPELDETVLTVSANAGPTELTKYFAESAGYVYITQEGVQKVFANDLTLKQQALIFATQTPAYHTVFNDKSGAPAWKVKPTWYVVAKGDKTINPDLERFMAKRMKAKTVELESSHVVMSARPQEVLKVIEEAANYKY